MKGEHEKAVVYFKRALRFNRSYASAWTLLGHEYMEMKNAYAAVEAYRRAVGMCILYQGTEMFSRLFNAEGHEHKLTLNTCRSRRLRPTGL